MRSGGEPRSDRGHEPEDSDRGQAVLLIALVLWLVVGIAVIMGALGQRAVQRARAQAAADAVALAAAAGVAPDTIAAGNAVVITSVDHVPDPDVVVSIGDIEAAARAHRTRPELAGLDARLRAAIARAELLIGEPIVVVSGFRSRADQQRLWAAREANPYPVAPPGTSLHELGLAIDVARHQASLLARSADRTGLCQPLPATDPIHFVLC